MIGPGPRTLLLLTVGRPLLAGASKAAVKWLFGGDDKSFQERLAQVRARAQDASPGPVTDAVPVTGAGPDAAEQASKPGGR